MNQIMTGASKQGKRVRQIILFCSPDSQTLTTLAEDLAHKLASGGYEASVLIYGNTPRRHDGVLLIETAHGAPMNFLQQLFGDRRIIDYVFCDAPGSGRVEGEQKQTGGPDSQAKAGPLSPPLIPATYIPLTEPRPLSRDDCYWIVRARSAGEGEGWLLYDRSGSCKEFFTIEESFTLLYTLLEQAESDLLPRLTPEYLALHARGVAMVRGRSGS